MVATAYVLISVNIGKEKQVFRELEKLDGVYQVDAIFGPYDIIASETQGCDSLYVKYTFVNNTLVDTLTSIFWDFGNGETSTSFDPDTVVYYPGIYSLNFILNEGTDNILLDTIKVYRTVSPDFVYSDTSQIAP